MKMKMMTRPDLWMPTRMICISCITCLATIVRNNKTISRAKSDDWTDDSGSKLPWQLYFKTVKVSNRSFTCS